MRALEIVPGISFSQMFSVHAVLDDEGRPLGEHRAPPDLAGAALTQFKQCPYAGTRYRHPLPMNISALRQASHHLDDIVAGFSFLNHLFGQGQPALKLAQMWRLLAAASTIPSYLLYRAAPQGDQPHLEGFIAALYKAGLGVKFMHEQYLMDALMAGRTIDCVADAEMLSAHSENTGVLVGLHQVCAAPPIMITETLKAIVQGGDINESQSSALAKIIGPADQFHEFISAAFDLYATLLVFSTLGARIQASLEKHMPALSAQLERREEGPLIEGLSNESDMSLTIGMRRICWPLSRLEQPQRTEMLKTFCGISSLDDTNQTDSPALSFLSKIESEDNIKNQASVARQLEDALSNQVQAAFSQESLVCISDLLAAYHQIERVACDSLSKIERRMNDALGRHAAVSDIASVLSGYCAISVWKTATEGLSIPMEGGSESSIRCGEKRITVEHLYPYS